MYQYPDSPPVVRVVLAQTDCSLAHNMRYFPRHQTGIPHTTRGKGTKHDRVTFQLMLSKQTNEESGLDTGLPIFSKVPGDNEERP